MKKFCSISWVCILSLVFFQTMLFFAAESNSRKSWGQDRVQDKRESVYELLFRHTRNIPFSFRERTFECFRHLDEKRKLSPSQFVVFRL